MRFQPVVTLIASGVVCPGRVLAMAIPLLASMKAAAPPATPIPSAHLPVRLVIPGIPFVIRT
jgi:hypothetical protein